MNMTGILKVEINKSLLKKQKNTNKQCKGINKAVQNLNGNIINKKKTKNYRVLKIKILGI